MIQREDRAEANRGAIGHNFSPQTRQFIDNPTTYRYIAGAKIVVGRIPK